MVTLPVTGIEIVDRELRRRKPRSAEAAEMMAARLLAAWRILRPVSDDNATTTNGRSQQNYRRR
jgi:hypothetical protein